MREPIVAILVIITLLSTNSFWDGFWLYFWLRILVEFFIWMYNFESDSELSISTITIGENNEKVS